MISCKLALTNKSVISPCFDLKFSYNTFVMISNESVIPIYFDI